MDVVGHVKIIIAHLKWVNRCKHRVVRRPSITGYMIRAQQQQRQWPPPTLMICGVITRTYAHAGAREISFGSIYNIIIMRAVVRQQRSLHESLSRGTNLILLRKIRNNHQHCYSLFDNCLKLMSLFRSTAATRRT